MKDIKLMLLYNYDHRCPKWLVDPKERKMTLSKKATKEEVDLFIIELLCQNYIDISKSMGECFENLIERSKTGLRLEGGIIFYEGDNEVIPGCCNDGIGNFKEIIEEIKENQPMIWLGHDPYPVFEYFENEIIVYSDDCLGIWGEEPLDKSEVISIRYEKKDLYDKFLRLDKDIVDFLIGPFHERISYYNKNYSDKLVSMVLDWLNIKS